MSDVFSLIFLADTKIIFRYDFVPPLNKEISMKYLNFRMNISATLNLKNTIATLCIVTIEKPELTCLLTL